MWGERDGQEQDGRDVERSYKTHGVHGKSVIATVTTSLERDFNKVTSHSLQSPSSFWSFSCSGCVCGIPEGRLEQSS